MPEIILALDPSTDFTGAALLSVDEAGTAVVVAFTSFDAFDLAGQPRSRAGLKDRIARMAATRQALSTWLGQQDTAPSVVAYETQSGRGHASSEALVMAVGSYLTLSRLVGLPLIEVNRAGGCAAVGASKVYAAPAGATNAERLAKRARLKQAVICGVNARLGLELLADQDAEADALCVGLAAAGKIASAAKLKMLKKTTAKLGSVAKKVSVARG